jgi:ABC-type bacteriocin/lantibiotic exporter with double-glycine peptidase domain
MIAVFATNIVIKPSDLYWAIGISLVLIVIGPILYGVAIIWTLVTIYMYAIHPHILKINNEPLLMQNGDGQWMIAEKEKPKQAKYKKGK